MNLDEFDGSNMQTGGKFNHEFIRKIITVDGQESEEYLLVKYDDWQNTLASGEILTLDELKDHLKEIDRDIDEYISKIKELEEWGGDK